MAKYFGTIGFVETKETTPGVWEPKVITRRYYGDLERRGRNRDNPTAINDDLRVNATISMEFIEYSGAVWKISSVDVQYPRLILTLGGVYNGEQA